MPEAFYFSLSVIRPVVHAAERNRYFTLLSVNGLMLQRF